MSAAAHEPEQRWRRTVDQRGRPLKLKVGRLLRDFGYDRLDPSVADSVESRLARVGLEVQPSLREVEGNEVVALALSREEGPGPAGVDAAPVELPWEQAPGATFDLVPPSGPAAPPPPAPPPPAPPPPAPPAPASQPVEAPALDELEQSSLVRAAVEAERRVRDAYDRAQAAAAGRITRLERELSAEKEAAARAREEIHDLERRLHEERREAAARLQALAEAEHAARSMLEAQREELAHYRQQAHASSAAIAQADEALETVRQQVDVAADDVRRTLGVPPPPDPAPGEPVDVPPADDAGPAPDASQAAADEPQTAAEVPEAEDAAPATEAATTAPFPDWAADVPHADEPRPGPLRRARGGILRRRAIVCAVCGTPAGNRDPEPLLRAGWRLTASAALCPRCTAEGWQLTQDDPVPFRPHDGR